MMPPAKLDKDDEPSSLNTSKESTKADDGIQLSDSQRARIERNRQKALMLKQARLTSQPYTLDPSHRY